MDNIKIIGRNSINNVKANNISNILLKIFFHFKIFINFFIITIQVKKLLNISLVTA